MKFNYFNNGGRKKLKNWRRMDESAEESSTFLSISVKIAKYNKGKLVKKIN